MFDHCRVTAETSVEKIILGRPWRTYATVVFLDTELDQKVDPAGWSEWHAEETHRLESAFYAEYQSQGPGANPRTREQYSRQLAESEAQKYRFRNFLAGADGWNQHHLGPFTAEGATKPTLLPFQAKARPSNSPDERHPSMYWKNAIAPCG